jgi:SHS2 domain-containing protein
MLSLSGYRENPHTADWELEVWAGDLPGLFEQAARGMYALAGVSLKSGPRQVRHLELEAIDAESLLVQFLEELLYLQAMAGLAFDQFKLHVSQVKLGADLEGAPLATLQKEIKAVTFHNLHIQKEQRGLVVTIVFDV